MKWDPTVFVGIERGKIPHDSASEISRKLIRLRAMLRALTTDARRSSKKAERLAGWRQRVLLKISQLENG